LPTRLPVRCSKDTVFFLLKTVFSYSFAGKDGTWKNPEHRNFGYDSIEFFFVISSTV